MNSVTDWFVGLLTIDGLLYFLAGFGTAYLWHSIKARMCNEPIQIPWHIAGIVVGVFVIVVVSVQSQVAYSTAEETAAEVQACQKEFNQALRDRSRIAAENDAISINQRRIMYDWIHELLFPPPPYSDMDINDPRRQRYALANTIETDQEFKRSLDQQEKLQAERERHPLPDPTCGRG